jgi:hypothetical protein
MTVDLINPDKNQVNASFTRMKKEHHIPSSIRDAIGRNTPSLDQAELDLASIEALNESPEAVGQELEKAIQQRIDNRRNRYANGSTHLPAEGWARVRQQAADECRRILTGTTNEAAEIELLRAEAADKLSQANARQSTFSRNSAELVALPKHIAKVTESLEQVTSAKAGLDKAKLEEAFRNVYLKSVFANDIGLFHRLRQEADGLFLALSSRSLRLAALEKCEAELTAELKKLADRQEELEKLLA